MMTSSSNLRMMVIPQRFLPISLTILMMMMTRLSYVYGAIEENEEQQQQQQQDDEDNDDTFIFQHSWTIVQFVSAFLPTIASLTAIFFLSAILSNTKVNNMSSFNVYLIWIIVPDLLLNMIVGVSLFHEGLHNGTYTPALCKTRNICSFFYYFTNLYLNAVVAREIDILVHNSYRRLRTRPPPLGKAFLQIGAVYVFTALLTTWMILDVRWSAFAITDVEYCITTSGSPTEDPVFTMWTGNIVGMLVIFPPFAYVFWIFFRIWKLKLLPIKGKTRAIALYFFRIVFVFFGFYLPSMVLAFIYMNIPDKYPTLRFWILWVFSLLIPAQTFVTLRLLLTKDDIRKAVKESSTRFLWNQTSASTTDMMAATSSSMVGNTDEWNQEDVYEEGNNNIT